MDEATEHTTADDAISPRDAWFADAPPRFRDALHALDTAVMSACPELDTRVAYGLLMYTLDGDTRHWICAIGSTKNAFQLRFLFGHLMDDCRGMLRAGTGTLRTLDFETLDDLDPTVVAEYVRDAVSRLDAFRSDH